MLVAAQRSFEIRAILLEHQLEAVTGRRDRLVDATPVELEHVLAVGGEDEQHVGGRGFRAAELPEVRGAADAASRPGVTEGAGACVETKLKRLVLDRSMSASGTSRRSAGAEKAMAIQTDARPMGAPPRRARSARRRSL